MSTGFSSLARPAYFLVAFALGLVRFTGGELKAGIISLRVEIVTLRRRLNEILDEEQPGLMIVACRLCGDEDIAGGLHGEVAFAAGRWPAGTGSAYLRYLYCKLLTKAVADEAFGTGPDQRAYLARRSGPRFAGLDPLARVQHALQRAELPADLVDDLLNVFARELRHPGPPAASAPGAPDA